ncbi:alpha/beta hydrolase [Chromobacterium sp. CV08]|uniref:alpha/beta hydrolase n=1 Tax=Chromobacterium sp. CV08 TaxID=3133274 RepID=UPI003DA80321
MTKVSLLFFISLTLISALFFDHWQRMKIFSPSHQLLPTPEERGIPFKNVWITVRNQQNEDKGILHAWWLPNKEASILYLHGNDSSISTDIDKILQIWNAGYSVLAVDYRGFGQSTKILPSESSVTEDAMAAWQYLKWISSGKNGIRAVYGHSLGSAIAINLGQQHPEVDYLILEGSFTSIADILKETGKYQWLPSFLLTQKFESFKKIKTIAIPKLFIHCDKDSVIPLSLAEKLYENSSTPKNKLIINGDDHQACSYAAQSDWKNHMQQILKIKNTSSK